VGVATPLGQVERIGRTPHVILTYSVSDQQTGPQVADLVLPQMTRVIAEPDHRRRTRGNTHQLVIDWLASCGRHDRRPLPCIHAQRPNSAARALASVRCNAWLAVLLSDMWVRDVGRDCPQPQNPVTEDGTR
jgi:hypothetical protein